MAVTGVAYVYGAGVATDPTCVERSCSRGCGVTYHIPAADAAKHDAGSARDRECHVCANKRYAIMREAGRKAHLAKLAAGTNYAIAWWLKRPWLPRWLAKRTETRNEKGRNVVSAQTVVVRDRLVFTPARVPVVLIDEETLDVVEWMTIDRLKVLWKKLANPATQRDLFGHKLALAPETARIDGEIPPLEVPE